MPNFIPPGVDVAIAARLTNSLRDLCSIKGPTYSAVKKTWGPPYTVVATNVPCDFVSGNPLDPAHQTIITEYKISIAAFRVVTLPSYILVSFPNIGRSELFGEWRVSKGGQDYIVLNVPNADETKPLDLVLHCKTTN